MQVRTISSVAPGWMHHTRSMLSSARALSLTIIKLRDICGAGSFTVGTLAAVMVTEHHRQETGHQERTSRQEEGNLVGLCLFVQRTCIINEAVVNAVISDCIQPRYILQPFTISMPN